MALIVITIKDQPDGSVSVQLLDEPACTPDQTEFTPAQHVGAIALNAVDNELHTRNLLEPAGQKLQLVGADELPLPN